MNGLLGINAVAFKYRDGVIAAVDTAATYGHLTVRGIQEIFQPTRECLVVFTGLLSDVQFLKRVIRQEIEEDDGREMDPQGIHRMVQRVLYQKRSKGTPLGISVIVCGFKENTMAHKTFALFNSDDPSGRVLGVVNEKGNFWFENAVATSFSSNFVLPLLRAQELETLGREDAIKAIEECFRVMCYKDCRATNSVQIGIVEASGVEVLPVRLVETDWLVGKQENEDEI